MKGQMTFGATRSAQALPEPLQPRPALTDAELWAHAGLNTMNDATRSRKKGSNGYSRMDKDRGQALYNKLTTQAGLLPTDWEKAIKLLTKYHRQIGKCPDPPAPPPPPAPPEPEALPEGYF